MNKTPEFIKTITKSVHLVTHFRPEGWAVDMEVVIVNENDGPKWSMTLIDWDRNTGAEAVFASEADALAGFEEFKVVAMDAYEKKLAKYGSVPVFRRGPDGKLLMDPYTHR